MSSGKVSPGWKLVRAHVEAGRVIVGIDEVGRGSWAGPVTAAAVILMPGARLAGLADSKLLTAAARERLDVTVRARAVAFGLGWATAAEVDEFGLSWAVKQSGLRALEDMLGCAAGVDHYDVVILDGNHNYLKAEFTAMDDPRFSEVFVKGDQKIIPVSAASIIAKVARDRYMTELAAKYPGYGFESHKGYGSKSHQKAIAELGFLDGVHRRSWKPFRETEKVDD